MSQRQASRSRAQTSRKAARQAVSAALHPPPLPNAWQAQILARYAAVARSFILEFFPPNSCIAASRITVEVLRRFGIEAQAFPVSMIAQVKARDLVFVSGVDMKGIAGEIRPCASPWHGHVIAIGAGHLIDASFDQFSMPAHGVSIPPFVLVAPLNDTTIRPENLHAVLDLVTDDGQSLSVQYFPLDDWSFKETPAWELDHLQPVINLICEEMVNA